MQKLIFTLIVGLTATVFATGSYLIYLQNENINLYAKQLLGTRQDYRKLELEYQKLKEKERQTVIIANGNTEKNTAISNLINNYTQKVNGDISVYYKNLATDESVRVNADKKYYMASLYKVILVLYVLDQIETGTTSLSDRVGTSSATLDVAIDKIITESNNEYAQTLANQYGWKNIEQAMKEKLGIEFSFKGDLQTSAKNIGRLFEKIAYSLNIADWQSEYLLSLMNNQKKTSKLPKYLPSNIYSHNKTGEFEDYSHDAGIFYTPRGNYILVFMSKSKNPGITDELMAKMSKDIFASLNPQTNTSQ
ncbi:MAG: serine hydrolase [Candidatus Levybacteria bacterium]|nr:serine hydrolase [Candidatus Levybacteria bacterium]